jgi:hypothetical protein
MRILMMLLLSVILASPAAAGELAGVMLPESNQVDGQNLVLNGMAIRKVALFKV